MGKFLSSRDKVEFIKKLKLGDVVIITRDLSRGDMVDNMISTMSILYVKSNYGFIKEIVYNQDILELKIENNL